MRILIVEDEVVLSLLLARFLRRLGYEVVTAISAEQAIEHLKLQTFEILMTDLQLPGMSGIDLIRTLGGSTKLRIILMSGDPSEYRQEDLTGLPIHAFLQKPFELKEIRKLLKDIRRE